MERQFTTQTVIGSTILTVLNNISRECKFDDCMMTLSVEMAMNVEERQDSPIIYRLPSSRTSSYVTMNV